MFRNRNFIKAMTAAALCGTALTAGLQVPLTVEAVSAATTQLHIIPGKEEATVNGAASSLEEPAALIEDSIYVPARWLAEQLGLQLNWNETSRTVGLLTSKGYIEFNPDGDTVSVNGNRTAFEGSAAIRHDRLLVKLSWIAPWLDIAYKYDESTRGVAIQFVGQVSTAYKESDLTAEDMQVNSRPIAKFAFDKPVYRLGEPVKIVDLSYDPDAEGLPDYEWTGKEEAYFEPGTYTVTLKVKDGKGNESEPFTKSVQVADAPYLSKADFPYYAKPEGSVFAYDSAVIPVLSAQDQEKKAGPAVPVLVRQPDEPAAA
ncbi:stalk domain-containing protein [Paenibacillus sp. TAB 01]|uniref:stalk domain-containing protein n=1 Tax=Paenibacillus sp. TAB 01 TaxID=3368988 RepID=UPI003751F982